MIVVVQGCDISTHKFIDEFVGIFAPLVENFRGFAEKNIIPANSSTFCPKRFTKHCNINCPKAVIGYKYQGKIVWRKIGARI